MNIPVKLYYIEYHSLINTFLNTNLSFFDYIEEKNGKKLY